jgi:glutamine amidotransferase
LAGHAGHADGIEGSIVCELFALSSLAPTTAKLSLDELARHGGATGPHADGWGVAFFEGTDVRIVRDADAASGSACLRFVREHDFVSNIVVAHVRKATRGEISLRNTQPFAREVGGRMHVFAHNGDLAGIEACPELDLGLDRPIGTTDSEHAFCALLRRMRPLWREASPPPLSARLAVVESFAREIGRLGPANFVYADGEVVFVHGHRRTQLDGCRRPPGLHVLSRTCNAPHHLHAAGLTIESTHARQEVVLVASVPLTDESWIPLLEGEILVLAAGRILGPDGGHVP